MWRGSGVITRSCDMRDPRLSPPRASRSREEVAAAQRPPQTDPTASPTTEPPGRPTPLAHTTGPHHRTAGLGRTTGPTAGRAAARSTASLDHRAAPLGPEDRAALAHRWPRSPRPHRRTAAPPHRRTAALPRRRAAGPPGRRTAGPPHRRVGPPRRPPASPGLTAGSLGVVAGPYRWPGTAGRLSPARWPASPAGEEAPAEVHGRGLRNRDQSLASAGCHGSRPAPWLAAAGCGRHRGWLPRVAAGTVAGCRGLRPAPWLAAAGCGRHRGWLPRVAAGGWLVAAGCGWRRAGRCGVCDWGGWLAGVRGQGSGVRGRGCGASGGAGVGVGRQGVGVGDWRVARCWYDLSWAVRS